MTKITFVFPSIGTELRYWAYIIEALEKRDCVVTLVGGLSSVKIRDKKKIASGGKFITIKRNFYGYNQGLILVNPRMAWYIAKTAPNVVIAIEYSVATMLAYLGARMCGAHFVIFQEHSVRQVFNLGVIRRLWRKMLLKFADLIIANTKEAMQEILYLSPTLHSKVKVIPLLVPPEREDMLKKEVELPKGSSRPIFTYVGQLITRKNVLCLVKAAGILKQAGYRFSVWIIGDGTEKSNLQRAVANQHLDDTVRFLGALPYESLGFVYAESDVFIMPTLSDYRSVAVLEALRFGKPVIDSTKDGNAGSMVVDGQNGFVFDPNDVNVLADRMKRFIEFPRLIEDMGRESVKRIHDLSPSRSAELLVKALQEIK